MAGWAACHKGEPPPLFMVLEAADALEAAVTAYSRNRCMTNELMMIGLAEEYRSIREAFRTTQT